MPGEVCDEVNQDVDTDLGFQTAVRSAWSFKWLPLSVPLGFYDDQMEREFLQMNQRLLQRMLKWLAVFSVIYTLLISALQFKSEGISGGMRRTHVVCWSLRLLVGLSPGVAAVCRPTELGCIGLSIIETIGVLIHHRSRAAYLSGELADVEEIFYSQTHATLNSDASVMASLALVSIFVQGIPVRARLSAVMVLLTPMLYAMFTLPLPPGVEGTAPRRLSNAGQLAGVALLSFLLRVHLELKERREFYLQCKLKGLLIKEKVKRVTAEHEAESGPFSTRASGASTATLLVLPDRESEVTSTDAMGSSLLFGKDMPEHMSEIRQAALVEKAAMEFWYIDREHLQMFHDCPLGQGGYGNVFRGRYQHADVAIKVASPGRSGETLLSELRMMRRVRHPCLVFFFGACFIEDTLCVVEELITGSTLKDIIKRCETVSARDRLNMLCGISSALIHLHCQQPSIVHGDLKPSNILVEAGSKKVKVIDFGLSCLDKPAAHYRGLTPYWASPEVLCNPQKTKPSPASDMFSFGLVAFFVVVGYEPHAGICNFELKLLARQNQQPSLAWPEAPVALQSECRELCCILLALNPADRPSAKAALENLSQWNADWALQSL